MSFKSRFKQYSTGEKGEKDFHEPDWRDEREKRWEGEN